jgi:hypothetical protein
MILLTVEHKTRLARYNPPIKFQINVAMFCDSRVFEIKCESSIKKAFIWIDFTQHNLLYGALHTFSYNLIWSLGGTCGNKECMWGKTNLAALFMHIHFIVNFIFLQIRLLVVSFLFLFLITFPYSGSNDGFSFWNASNSLFHILQSCSCCSCSNVLRTYPSIKPFWCFFHCIFRQWTCSTLELFKCFIHVVGMVWVWFDDFFRHHICWQNQQDVRWFSLDWQVCQRVEFDVF